MEHTDAEGDEQNNRQGHPERPIHLHEHIGETAAHQADDGTDRKIDAGGDDDESDADADDSEQGCPSHQILNVGVAQKRFRIGYGRDHGHNDQQSEDSKYLFHSSLSNASGLEGQFELIPVASCMIDSSVSSLRGSSPVMRPSCITNARSAMPMISSISLETKRMAEPGCDSLA